MSNARRAAVAVLAVILLAGIAVLLLRPAGDDVEAQLRQAAAQLGPFPRTIDEGTEMTDARVEGRHMIYLYRVLRPEAFDAAAQQARLRQVVCSTAEMRAAMQQHGVRFTYEYRAPGGEVLARVEMTRCD